MSLPVRRIVRGALPLVTLVVALFTVGISPLFGWGVHGHELTGAAAAAALPAEMPAFFRDAAPRLAYLNPDPDRWRERDERAIDAALDGANAPDHYIDMDLIPSARLAGALAAPDRYAYIDTLRALGLEGNKVGFLPFRILELSQRLRIEFRLWRAATDSAQRRWIEARIIDDAGILGHFVADGSNPAHTTLQYNGWVGDNPKGYTTDKTFHFRFESSYVETHIQLGDVEPLVGRAPAALHALRPAILLYLHQTGGLVDSLYALEKEEPFGPNTTREDHERFTAERLAAGAQMLRDIWWTAWVTSAAPDSARGT